MRVLVSGFGPFLEEKSNPTEGIVNFVNSCAAHTREAAAWAALDVRGVILPVEFDQAFQRLEQERLLFKPDVILSFGLAGNREHFEIEQVAINSRGAGPVCANALLALPTTLPSEAMLQSLVAAGLPARFSFSAGTYVCNDLFFQMQNRLRMTRIRSGFIHVPRSGRFEDAVGALLSALATEVDGPRA